MREIGAFEAKNHLSQLLDWVEAGEEISITRRGKTVAKLVAPDQGLNRERGRRAAAALRTLREGHALGGLNIRDLINEGRR